jgi:cytochrome c551/c552
VNPNPSTPRAKALFIKLVKIGLPVVLVIFVGIQFVPVDAIQSAPVRSEMKEEPPEVVALLKRACFDCHSNETEWPWYSRIAPASWLVAKDVIEGRESINFSDWDGMDADDRQYNREACRDEVAEGEMPPWFYIPMHPEAKISEAEVALLTKWFESHEDDEDEGDDEDQADEDDKDDEKPEGEQKDDDAKEDGAKEDGAEAE